MGIPECLTTVKSQTSGNFLKKLGKGVDKWRKTLYYNQAVAEADRHR